MGYYVYIIQSEADKSFYKGFSENPAVRLLQHNSGESRYASGKLPWQLIYIEACATKKDALIREKVLKKYSREQINNLILSPKNIISSIG